MAVWWGSMVVKTRRLQPSIHFNLMKGRPGKWNPNYHTNMDRSLAINFFKKVAILPPPGPSSILKLWNSSSPINKEEGWLHIFDYIFAYRSPRYKMAFLIFVVITWNLLAKIWSELIRFRPDRMTFLQKIL